MKDSDLKLEEIKKQCEKEKIELEEKIKYLTRKNLQLAFIQEELERKILELEKLREEQIVLRIREKAKSRDIEKKVIELERLKKSLMEALEDTYQARQRELQEKNKTLALIQNFADGVLVFDHEGKVSLVNPQAENFLKVKKEEIIGKSFLELAQFLNFKPIYKALKSELNLVFRKMVDITENFVLEVTTIPLVTNKETIGTLMVLHDITREKEIERMKTEFVSIAAHQLRTPLSAIKWILKMLLEGDIGELSKEQREFLEKAYNSNERIIGLINDLLNVSRIEEGRYLYRPVLADIVSICQSVIDALKEMIEQKKLKLTFEKEKDLPKVKVDVEKISLAIQNLLENAIKYNKVEGEIKINLKKKNNEIEFSIKDTGIGIPENQKNRLFTKFFRGSNALKTDTEGSGLGLFIVKNVIEAHGGRIWFESEEGKGTTFYFTLPIVIEVKH
jgi:PAS domain S-box-containing protein